MCVCVWVRLEGGDKSKLKPLTENHLVPVILSETLGAAGGFPLEEAATASLREVCVFIFGIAFLLGLQYLSSGGVNKNIDGAESRYRAKIGR